MKPNAGVFNAKRRWLSFCQLTFIGVAVQPGQTVSLLPGARLEEMRPVSVLVHKPAGLSASDPAESALDLVVPANLMPGDRSGQRYLKRMFIMESESCKFVGDRLGGIDFRHCSVNLQTVAVYDSNQVVQLFMSSEHSRFPNLTFFNFSIT